MKTALNPKPNLEDFDLIIVDAFSLLFRAYYSFPATLTSPGGKQTNAVYGFGRMLLTLLRHTNPRYLITATDMEGDTFRHQAYEQYKANREEPDIELKEQIPLMFELLDALNIPTLGLVGFEADDVIGTLSKQVAKHADLLVGIFTSDKDMLQLVNGQVFVLWPERKGNGQISVLGQAEVVEKLGVRAEQVIDYKALCGDSSDNIPGIAGIGPKTAQQILAHFNSLLELYQALEIVKNQTFIPDEIRRNDPTPEQQAAWTNALAQLRSSVIKKLTEQATNAWLSQSLARIDTQIDVQLDLDQAKLSAYDKDQATQFFDKLGFQSLKKHLPQDDFEAQVQASLFG